MTNTRQQTIRDAMQKLRTGGWGQLGREGMNGGLCIGLALSVCGDADADFTASFAVMEHLGLPNAGEPGLYFVAELYRWNDTEGRTLADVLAALESTADTLDALEAAQAAANGPPVVVALTVGAERELV